MLERASEEFWISVLVKLTCLPDRFLPMFSINDVNKSFPSI